MLCLLCLLAATLLPGSAGLSFVTMRFESFLVVTHILY